MPPHLAGSRPGLLFQARMGVPRRAGDASELRKTLKPLMEKRRRARINESLNQLKGLILPLIGKDSSRYSKLEKADILEMTVRFLQELPTSGAPATPTPAESYREGYRACVSRLAGLLPACSLLDRDVCGRLLDHLQRSGGAAAPSPRGSKARGPDPRAAPASPAPPAHRPAPPPRPAPSGLWRPW
ncbi:transcription factor HES-2 [Ornithorhynchus anatinus]|uniref:transcription factor HES-2 n=1 Tax=Ornithorhynchus anatinus TaxID=9258 RepID=UPI0010A7BE64|nr:transcription factor HES-2 [Ornithorhynchus anatinus]